MLPMTSSLVRVKVPPATRWIGSGSMVLSLIFGPGRSPMIATRRPVALQALRIRSMTSACWSKLPCEKLSRATFMPARMRRSSISGDCEAGPMVATILVLWSGKIIFDNSKLVLRRPPAQVSPLTLVLKRSVATFRFCRKTPRFRDFAEKPVVDCEALRQGGFRAKSGFFEESNLCNTSPEADALKILRDDAAIVLGMGKSGREIARLKSR